MTRKPRALTMLELVAVLVILGLLGTFSVFGVRSVISRAQRGGAIMRLESARAAGRAAAASNGNTFPYDMVTRTPVSGIKLVSAAATGTFVSVYRASGSAVSYATLDGDGGCAGVSDNIVTRVVVFVRDRSVSAANCTASRVAGLGLTTAADQNNATIVDLDAATAATTTSPGATTTPTTAAPTVPAQPLLSSFALRAGSTASDEVLDMVVLNDGSTVLAGYFSGTSSFGSTSLTSAGSTDVFIGKVSSSGTWQWAVRAGGTGTDTAKAVGVTSQGAVFVAGSFATSATFGATTLSSGAQTGLFVALLDASGAWKWAVSSSGTANASYADSVNALAVSTDNTAVVGGQISGTPVLGSSSFTASGGVDAFVGRIDQYGTWQWATPAVSAGTTDYVSTLAVLPDGTIAAGGSHSGAAFASTTLTRSGPSSDGFTARLSSSGSWQWAVGVASSSGNNAVTGISYAQDGSLMVAGSFWGTTAFGSSALTSLGSSDVFVAKASLSGQWAWASGAGSTSADAAYQVVALPDLSAVVSTTIQGSATYGSIAVSHPNPGADDVVVGKVTSSGVWSFATRGGSAATDRAYAIKGRGDGSFAVAGCLNSGGGAGTSATFGSFTLTASGSSDMLLVTLSASGALS